MGRPDDDGSSYYHDHHNVLVYGGYKNFLGDHKGADSNLYLFPDLPRSTIAWLRSSCMDYSSPGAGESYTNNTCVLLNGTRASPYLGLSCDATDPLAAPRLGGNRFLSLDGVWATTCTDGRRLSLPELQALGLDAGSTAGRLNRCLRLEIRRAPPVRLPEVFPLTSVECTAPEEAVRPLWGRVQSRGGRPLTHVHSLPPDARVQSGGGLPLACFHSLRCVPVQPRGGAPVGGRSPARRAGSTAGRRRSPARPHRLWSRPASEWPVSPARGWSPPVDLTGEGDGCESLCTMAPKPVGMAGHTHTHTRTQTHRHTYTKPHHARTHTRKGGKKRNRPSSWPSSGKITIPHKGDKARRLSFDADDTGGCRSQRTVVMVRGSFFQMNVMKETQGLPVPASVVQDAGEAAPTRAMGLLALERAAALLVLGGAGGGGRCACSRPRHLAQDGEQQHLPTATAAHGHGPYADTRVVSSGLRCRRGCTVQGR